MELPLPVDHSGVKYRKKRASDTNFEYINMNQTILAEFLGILSISWRGDGQMPKRWAENIGNLVR